MGRELQTQDETADGNRLVSDLQYDSDGWQLLVSSPYYATGAPSTSQVTPASDDQVPSQTGYVYDGDGRVTRQISYELANETWETDTAHGGDYTTVTYQNDVAGEPDGGTPETTFTNGEGQTSRHLAIPLRGHPLRQRPGRRLRPDQLHLHPRRAAPHDHRRPRQHLDLQLQPGRRPDQRVRPRHRNHHQQLRPGRGAHLGHRQPERPGLLRLRRRRPEDRRVQHHRRRNRVVIRRARLLGLRHEHQEGAAHLIHLLLQRLRLHQAGHRLQRLRRTHGIGHDHPEQLRRLPRGHLGADLHRQHLHRPGERLPGQRRRRPARRGRRHRPQRRRPGDRAHVRGLGLRRHPLLHRVRAAAGVHPRHHCHPGLDQGHRRRAEPGPAGHVADADRDDPGHRRRHRLQLRQHPDHRGGRHPGHRHRPGPVLHLRLPRPPVDRLVAGQHDLPVGRLPVRRVRGRGRVLGPVPVRHRRRPDQGHRHPAVRYRHRHPDRLQRGPVPADPAGARHLRRDHHPASGGTQSASYAYDQSGT